MQAMFSSHMLMNISGSTATQNTNSHLYQVPQSQINTDNTSRLIQPSSNGLVSPRQLGHIEMAPLRNHHSVMPPPPHIYLNNNSIQKNYNNNSSRNFWNSQKLPEGGDCSRSTTPRSYDSDDSCHSQSQSPVPELKGVKRLHDVYGTQQAFFQQAGIHHSSNGYFYNTQRAQNPLLPPQINHYNLYPPKRRFQNNNNNNNNSRNGTGNRNRRSIVGGVQQIIAPDRYLARADEIEVHGEPANLRVGSVWDDLSVDIWNQFINNQQTVSTYKEKMHLWKALYILIKTTYPRYGLFLVGSTISGFGSNSSDMDMCLLIRPTEMDQRCEAVVHLEIVQKLLKQCDFIQKLDLIQAKVPILKFSDSKRRLEVDLNCNNSVGIRNTHLLRCYANMDWRVRPLVLIVKLWARQHHINDAKNMTISSYSLALMVIHFLQCGVTPPVVPCLQGVYQNKFSSHADIHTIDMHEQLLPFQSDNTQTLGELFVAFLGYYSCFDYNNHAISIRLGARIPIDECRRARSAKNDPHQWKHLCIEEPFDLTNTARSVYDPAIFEHVKNVFLESFHRLKDTRNLFSVFSNNDVKMSR